MPELSPAARTVLTAYLDADFTDEASVAAVLRAAADQVVPLADEPEFFCGNCCERNVTQEREDIRRELLAIANELQAQ